MPPAAPVLTEIEEERLGADAQVTGAELVVRALEAVGVTKVFGYPGGAIMPIYDALPACGLMHYLTRHEQGAIHAAEGYARSSGKLGVVMATSGPGATNLVTGLADAMLDSVPILAITGQVASPLMGTDAFQEVDVFGVTLAVVKHSYLIRAPEEIPGVITEAAHIAMSGRPGPVLIDIPKDIAQARIDTPRRMVARGRIPEIAPRDLLDKAERMVQAAERPLLYVGGGVAMGGAIDAFRRFVDRTGIPTVATLKGLGSIRPDNENYLGMLGMHGNKGANLAVQNCDLLIAVGARFDDRATGRVDSFAAGAKVLHFDVDESEFGKIRRANIALPGCLKSNLDALDPGPLLIREWREACQDLKERNAWRYDAPAKGIYAPALLKELSEKATPDAIIACDVGQHQMWVAQHCLFNHPANHLTSGGLGTMGYGLPAGIGAKIANPDRTVITVSGDGSFMMNIQELQTLYRYEVPLKIVLLDNQALGMVRQWQELFYEGNYSEIDLSDNPDFVEVAKAFRIQAFRITEPGEVSQGIDRLLAAKGPILMHVRIDSKENVWPLVAPGKANDEMMEQSW